MITRKGIPVVQLGKKCADSDSRIPISNPPRSVNGNDANFPTTAARAGTTSSDPSLGDMPVIGAIKSPRTPPERRQRSS